MRILAIEAQHHQHNHDNHAHFDIDAFTETERVSVTHMRTDSLYRNALKVIITPDSAVVDKLEKFQVHVIPQTKVLLPNSKVKVRFITGYDRLQRSIGYNPSFCSVGTNIASENAIFESIELAQLAYHSSWDSDAHSSVMTAIVKNDTLQIGDTLTINIGYGHPNARALTTRRCLEEQLQVIANFEPNKEYVKQENTSQFRIVNDVVADLRLVLNSKAKQNESFLLKLMVMDAFGNPVDNFQGSVSLSSDAAINNLPTNIQFDGSENGVKQIEISSSSEGFFKVSGILLNNIDGYVDEATSNFIKISSDEDYIYWGDMHNHSSISRDAIGTRPYYYAKYLTGLDFFTTSEHTTMSPDTFGINATEWLKIKQDVIDFHEDGKFVTFMGYETSYPKPSGHYNFVYSFVNEDIDKVPQLPRMFALTIQDAWQKLDTLDQSIEVVTFPHHTGKRFAWWKPSTSVNFFGGNYASEKYKRNFEIYSTHGLSEYYAPNHNLSYGNNNQDAGSENGPYYAQDAWAIGEKLSVIACSDNHIALPSQNNEGVTAVIANNLTRNDVMTALKTRATYATTGERIIIDFKVDDAIMGSEVEVDYGDSVEVTYSIKGTDAIDKVEILKWDFRYGIYESGHPKFEIVHTNDLSATNNDVAEGNFMDMIVTDSCLYYLRVKQQNKVSGYEVWGWTSPVWIKALGAPTAVFGNINTNLAVSLVQNPLAANQPLNLKLDLKEAMQFNLELFNAAGQSMLKRNLSLEQGQTLQTIDVPQGLSKGYYFIAIQSADSRGQIAIPFAVQ